RFCLDAGMKAQKLGSTQVQKRQPWTTRGGRRSGNRLAVAMLPCAAVVDRRDFVRAAVEDDAAESHRSGHVNRELLAHAAQVEILEHQVPAGDYRDSRGCLRPPEAVVDLAAADIDRPI